MDSADVLQLLGAGLSFLPYYFPEDKVTAWETASKQKLSALSDAAAAHAGKVLVAVGAVVAASFAFIEHHASAFFRVAAITGEQHPHEAVSLLTCYRDWKDTHLLVLALVASMPLSTSRK
jgi:pyrroloquinoline quinone (PQQ) biosynthesis protein C